MKTTTGTRTQAVYTWGTLDVLTGDWPRSLGWKQIETVEHKQSTYSIWVGNVRMNRFRKITIERDHPFTEDETRLAVVNWLEDGDNIPTCEWLGVESPQEDVGARRRF